MIETCVDTCCLINLHNAGVLATIAASGVRRLMYQGLVEDELRDLRGDLAALTDAGIIQAIPGSQIFASEVAQILRRYDLGLGESECIAIGLRRGISVASDDNKARSAAKAELGADRVIGSIGLLKEAVIGGVLSTAEAYAAYVEMRAMGAFLPALTLTDF